MPMVKVWNDNKYDYTEQFRDQLIKIKAGAFIEMEEGEALLFKGSFSPVFLDGNGIPTPQSYKKIRIEAITDEAPAEAVAPTWICNACRYDASSAKDLDEHCKSDHAELVVRDEAAEREIATRKTRSKKAG